MIVGNEPSVWSRYETSLTKRSGERTGSDTQPAVYGDSVSISDEARQLGKDVNLVTLDEYSLTGYSTDLAATGTALEKYLAANRTNLTALNQNRKAIGARIDSILKGLGVKLGKDEKIAITVDGKNQIKVSGIKDKQRAKKIEEALNADEKLGKDMRKHSVAGKLGEYAKAMENYQKDYSSFSEAMGQDIGDAFTSPGMRSFIIEEYLQDNAGVSLNDLSVERGSDGSVSILGMNSELSALLAEDPTLGSTIADIIDKGEVNSGFSATFEFANGTISDSTTADAAKAKIEKVKLYLMGGVDPDTGEEIRGVMPEALESIRNNTSDVDEELEKALGRGVSIRVAANGEFELVGLDDLNPKYRQLLEGLVEEALALAADDYGVASFSDVADAYINQHEFEHGDTREYAHMVEINFAAGGSSLAKVVSPDADKAQDEANQEVAGKLGEKLKGMLDEQGVDVAGMELEIDETGKITVLGGVDEAERKKAQAIIDQFVQEAKSAGQASGKADGEDEELVRETEQERRDAVYGDKKEKDHVPDGYVERDVVARADTAAMREAAWREEVTEQVRHLLPDPELKDDKSRMELEKFLNWQKYMPGNAEGGPHLGNNAFKVSNVQGPQFGGRTGSKEDGGDSAFALYGELLDGMKNFHDERRSVNYKLAAA